MSGLVSSALVAAVGVVLAPALLAGCAVDLGMDDEPAEALGGGASAIVHGEATTDFATAGVLLTGGDPSWLVCSGTLIGCDRFLTAAHCVCFEGEDCQETAPVVPMRVFLQHAGFFDVIAQHVHPAFSFPDNDVAVLELGRPAVGLRPSLLADAPPALGDEGVIVGFGRSGGGDQDYGIKQFGSIVTADCPESVSDPGHVCWMYQGSGSNTCSGDSGGPLFVEGPSGQLALAGVTSGGTRTDCLFGDHSYDNEVSWFADYIAGAAGGPERVGQASCGDLPQLGQAGAAVASQQGILPAGESASFEVEVPAGTAELRVALNSTEGSNADLYIRAGRPASALNYDCAADSPDSYAFCQVTSPLPGIWHLLVHAVGAGEFQVTTTTLAGAPVAAGDSYAMDAGAALDVGAPAGVLANDAQVGRGPLAAEVSGGPQHGSLELRPDGSFHYAPRPGYAGEDSFTYRASDDAYAGSARVSIGIAAPAVNGTDTGDEAARDDVDGGCAAAARGGPGQAAWLLLALGLIGVVRRARPACRK